MRFASRFVFMLCFLGITFGTLPSLSYAICARVKIEIKQELTLERQGFSAHMRINNGIDFSSLEDVHVAVSFMDEDGNPVQATSDPGNSDAFFYIRVDEMENIETVDGSGTVAAGSSADIYWLIVPAPGASNGLESGALYYVGATLSYTLDGQEKSVEVSPDYIFVKPMPEMTLDYFLPTDVYGDDPHTVEIEPIIPYSLGVLVSNNGYGTAWDLKIESAQPEIVENELGLLIGFKIVGSEVNGEAATPSLLADFGDIAPNSKGTARWLMTSSLSGKFIDFEAEFTHTDELGGELTSLISAVNTHTLVGDVLVDLPGRDLIRDFLAEDTGILSVYESDAGVTEVLDQSSHAALVPDPVSGEGYYTLSVPVTAGFMYVQLSDPEGGNRELLEVIRSDGKRIAITNGWLSKTRDEDGPWQHSVNLFDVNTTDSYTLVFVDPAVIPDAPVMQFIPNRTVSAGDQVSFLIEASDPDGTIPTLSASSLPMGAEFVDEGNTGNGIATGIFDWTPAVGQSGSYRMFFSASDGRFTTTKSAVINVATSEDIDGDGLSNTLEESTCTDPNKADTDNDGLMDGEEDRNRNGVVDPGESNPCDSDTVDSDGDGISDVWELFYFDNLDRNGTGDFDQDGSRDLDEFEDDTDPSVPDIRLQLTTGLNLISIPISIEPALSASELLTEFTQALISISCIDPVSQTVAEMSYNNGNPQGDDFTLLPGAGYILTAAEPADSLLRGEAAAHGVDFSTGSNLVGFIALVDGYSAYQLLQDIGDATVVASIQRFNRSTGQFETVAYQDGNPVGPDFVIIRGEGYIITMHQEVAGFVVP